MEKRTKRKLLIGGAALAMAGATTGGYTAFAGGQNTTRHDANAAAPAGAVRAQRVDDNHCDGPLSSPICARFHNPKTNVQIHVRVRNHAAFSAGVCVTNGVGANCTGDADVSPNETDLTVDVPPKVIVDKGPPDLVRVVAPTATVRGFVRDGLTGDLQTKNDVDTQMTFPAPPSRTNTFCYRFDGTIRVGFSFKQVNCSDM